MSINKPALLSIAVAAGLIVTLTGCSSVGGAKGDSGDTKPPVSRSESSAEEAEAAPAVAANVLKFGDTYTWEDDMSMSVSLGAYVPTEYAAGVDHANQILVTVTLTNNSAETFEPLVMGSMVSGGVTASSITDIGGPVELAVFAPTDPVLPGNSITWNEAWSVADPATLQYSIAPATLGYDDAIFTS
ncbi:hypothetical protein ACI3KX_02455 [Microbacterium sp. ZW CA_36]|uniref:hypothetical protein n=1 Tax=Microbacterium sp. ZW CA_36 TaxID=3378078 RepID=UPI003853D081